MKHEPQIEYLAYTNLGSGGGSYARDHDAARAIRRCVAIAISDWKLDGATIEVGLWHITGHDTVVMRDGGVFTKSPDGKTPGRELQLLDIKKITVPTLKKKKVAQ